MSALLLVLAVASAPLAAQDTVRGTLRDAGPADTLSFTAFYDAVRRNHPVARQAELIGRQAGAEVLAARGAILDPKVEVDWDRKRFDAKTYYDYLSAALKIPTPTGVEIKLGFERNRGQFASSDIETTNAGYFVAGISVPLARGILTDERRNAVAQALALRDLAAGEQLAQVNKLLFGAAKDYAAWYDAHRRRLIAEEGIELARFRLTAVLARFRNGEVPAIDTVEATLEVQRREVTALEARANYFAQTQVINRYLWDDRVAPYDLADNAVPTLAGLEVTPLDTTSVDGWLAQALRRHPDIVKAAAKVRQAEVNRLFFAQGLLPDARIEGSALADAGTAGVFGSNWPPTSGNYKLGFSGSQSLLLMKERGKLNSARYKLQSSELEQAFTVRDVRLEVRTAVNDLVTFERILDLQVQAVEAARRLRDGEFRRYENGESTLFLVNTRDRTVLDEQVKLASYQAKYAGSRAALAVALGQPAVIPPVPASR